MSSARLAYQLNTCEELRLNTICDMNKEPNFVLFVNLSIHYLEVALLELSKNTVNIKNGLLSLILGAERSAKEDTWIADINSVLTNFVSLTWFETRKIIFNIYWLLFSVARLIKRLWKH